MNIAAERCDWSVGTSSSTVSEDVSESILVTVNGAEIFLSPERARHMASMLLLCIQAIEADTLPLQGARL